MTAPSNYRIEITEQGDGRWLFTREGHDGTTARGWFNAGSALIGSFSHDAIGLVKIIAREILAAGRPCRIVSLKGEVEL